MDHSIQGYLQRRTNEELMIILAAFQNDEAEEWNREVISMVAEVLRKRGFEMDVSGLE